MWNLNKQKQIKNKLIDTKNRLMICRGWEWEVKEMGKMGPKLKRKKIINSKVKRQTRNWMTKFLHNILNINLLNVRSTCKYIRKIGNNLGTPK